MNRSNAKTWRYENLGNAFQNGGEEPIKKKNFQFIRDQVFV